MIKIYTFAVNRPDFLEYQFRTFKHFMNEDHQMIVINDGHDGDSQRIADMAKHLGIDCHTVADARRDTANYGHARSIQFAYENFIKHDSDISLMLDGDMFLGRHFSARELTNGYGLAALQQSREHVYYMWPGIVFMDMAVLQDKDALSFWPDIVDGVGVDVGGHSYEYMRDHPDIKVNWFTSSGQLHPRNNNMENLPEGITPLYDPEFYIEIIAKAFIHYGGGTNWYQKTQEFHDAKSSFMFKFLDQLMFSPDTCRLPD